MAEFQLTPAQRAAGIERIAENLALISGAGCGKTFVLARRYVELLTCAGAGDNGLSGLVAVTFTRKAALEMAQRVGAMLQDRLAQAGPDRRAQIQGWIQQLPEARIGTIHSFCSSLLHTWALQAGLDPEFSVRSDDLLTGRLRAEAADQALLQAVEDEQPDVADLLSRTGFARLVEQIEMLLANRCRVDLSAYGDPETILARWNQRLQVVRAEACQKLSRDQTLRDGINYLAGFACNDPTDKLAVHLDEQLQLLQRLMRGPGGPAADVFAQLNAKMRSIGTAAAWGSKATAKEIRDRLKELIAHARTYEPALQEPGPGDADAAAALATLVRLTRQAEQRYAREKRRRGILDFDDLLQRTGELVARRPEIASRIAEGIDQLLIDECQDTDAFQIRLLETLAGGSQDSLPPGRLFVVGDPKQSIYRFRGTQVEVFRDLCDRLGPARRETLDLSFRAHPAATAWINDLFSKLMGPDYGPIRAHRQTVPPHPCVEILLAEGPHGPPDSADASTRAQAAVVAARIREMVESRQALVWDPRAGQHRPVRYGDVAILFSRMTVSLAYEQALAAEALPYYVIGGSGFLNRQEVVDVLNALRAVDSPCDDIALMGLLRSALVGLDDNALMRIALAVDAPYGPALQSSGVRQQLAESMPPGQFAQLIGWLDRLARWQRRKDAVGIDEMIQQILDAAGAEAVWLTDFHGAQAVGNIRRILEWARTASADGLSLTAFLSQISEHQLSNDRFEQAAVAGEHEDVVRLMTIHKSKGLEFPVVVIPDLNARIDSPSDRLLLRPDWGLTCQLPAGPGIDKADDCLAHTLALQAESVDETAEQIRKLYVAATRMQDHLVLVGANYRTKADTFNPSRSYLSWLDEALDVRTAVEQGDGEIPYGPGGQYAARARIVPAPGRRRRAGRTSTGDRMLQQAGDEVKLAAAIRREAGGEARLDLVGPVDPAIGRFPLAVTALNDFARCPRLFHLRCELAMPPLDRAADPRRPGRPDAMDPLRLGTLLHRCMELYRPGGQVSARSLLTRAAAETEGDPGLTDPVEPLLADILTQARTSGLAEMLAGAGQVHRELDFVSRLGSAELRGQIDLLLRDAKGRWRLIDYKSDRLNGTDPESHGRAYRMQLAVYADAAARFLGAPVAAAGLYFLRSGQWAWLAETESVLSEARRLIVELTEARRTGSYPVGQDGCCRGCPYGPMCGSDATG